MSLDILDRTKLVQFYYKCKMLYLVDIVPLIIEFILNTQQYVLTTKYDMCSIPNISIGAPITEHTAHLLLKMLLNTYPEFNEYILKQIPIDYVLDVQIYQSLVIKNITINNNNLILTLNIKELIYVSTPYESRSHARYIVINDYILKL